MSYILLRSMNSTIICLNIMNHLSSQSNILPLCILIPHLTIMSHLLFVYQRTALQVITYRSSSIREVFRLWLSYINTLVKLLWFLTIKLFCHLGTLINLNLSSLFTQVIMGYVCKWNKTLKGFGFLTLWWKQNGNIFLKWWLWFVQPMKLYSR